MLPRILTVGPLVAAADNNISTSQTPAGAGNLTITGALASGGVATLDVARRILVTTVSDESSKTLTLYGTDRSGNVISEAMTGPNATTAYTSKDFKTLTRVAVSAAFTGAVKVGTNGVASSPWIMLNFHAINFLVGIGVKVTGTVNYTIQTTYDDLMGYYSAGVGTVWNDAGIPVTYDDPVGGSTVNDEFQLVTPVRAVRITLNSGSGTAVATVIESGIRG